MLIKENYTSKKDLKRRLSQIRKVHGSSSISVRNITHVDRLGQRSRSKRYEIRGVVRGEYYEYSDDKIMGYIEYFSEQKIAIPPRDE